MKTNAKIYVMRAEDGSLKLGHSIDPLARSKQIGINVRIVHETDVLEHVERIERLAHRVLALHGRHLRGEWFEATLEDAITAIEIATRQAESEELPLGKSICATGSTKTDIAIRFDTALLTELDRFKESLEYETSRTSLIERAVRQMLDREAKVVGMARRRK